MPSLVSTSALETILSVNFLRLLSNGQLLLLLQSHVVKICYPFFATTDYIFYIIHAAITNLDIITIEDLVILVISTKIFVQ